MVKKKFEVKEMRAQMAALAVLAMLLFVMLFTFRPQLTGFSVFEYNESYYDYSITLPRGAEVLSASLNVSGNSSLSYFELDVGNDSIMDFNGTANATFSGSSFVNALNALMPACTCPGCVINSSDCKIPLVVGSNGSFVVLSNLNISSEESFLVYVPVPNASLQKSMVYTNYFNLSQYFWDPDNDTIIFGDNNTATHPNVNIAFSGDLVSLVTLPSFAGNESVYFTAKDSGVNASNTTIISNQVWLNFIASSSGGGSGGHGRCSERWTCTDWSGCAPGALKNVRNCTDLNKCDNRIPIYPMPVVEEFCKLSSTCYNGKIDGSEEGVDCGGRCSACPAPAVEQPAVVEQPLNICSDKFSSWHLIALILIIYFVLCIVDAVYDYRMKKKSKPVPAWIIKFKKSIWTLVGMAVVLIVLSLIMLYVDFACFESCLIFKSKYLLLLSSLILAVWLSYIIYRRVKKMPQLKLVLDEDWKKILFFLVALAFVLILLLLHLFFTKTCIVSTSMGPVIKESPGMIGSSPWIFFVLIVGLFAVLIYAIFSYERRHFEPAVHNEMPLEVKATPLASRLVKKSKVLASKFKPSVVHHQLEALPHAKPVESKGFSDAEFDKLVREVMRRSKLPGFDAVEAAEALSGYFKKLPQEVQAKNFKKFFNAVDHVEKAIR